MLLLFPFSVIFNNLYTYSFPGGTSGKALICLCSRLKRCGFGPWIGKIPGGGHDNSLRYSFLENPMDRGAWRATVHRVVELDMTEVT